jgi:hypothetical protein
MPPPKTYRALISHTFFSPGTARIPALPSTFGFRVETGVDGKAQTVCGLPYARSLFPVRANRLAEQSNDSGPGWNPQNQ